MTTSFKYTKPNHTVRGRTRARESLLQENERPVTGAHGSLYSVADASETSCDAMGWARAHVRELAIGLLQANVAFEAGDAS